jgi:hypothetical protein
MKSPLPLFKSWQRAFQCGTGNVFCADTAKSYLIKKLKNMTSDLMILNA